MEEYNWNLILKASVPFALVEGYLFYANLSNVWKWLSLIVALVLTGWIVYLKDKRKNSIFTAMGIVFLAVLVVKFLKNAGII